MKSAAIRRFLSAAPTFPEMGVLYRCFRTRKELMALAATKALSYASAGNGSANHLAGAFLASMAGVKLTHVPYKGAGPALSDLLSGNIQLMFDTLGTAPTDALKLQQVLAIAEAGARGPRK